MTWAAQILICLFTFFNARAQTSPKPSTQEQQQVVPVIMMESIENKEPNRIFVPSMALKYDDSTVEVWQNRDNPDEQIAIKKRTPLSPQREVPFAEDNIFNRERMINLGIGFSELFFVSKKNFETTAGHLPGDQVGLETITQRASFSPYLEIGIRPPGEKLKGLYFGVTGGPGGHGDDTRKEGAYNAYVSRYVGTQLRNFWGYMVRNGDVFVEQDIKLLNSKSAISAGVYTSRKGMQYFPAEGPESAVYMTHELGGQIRLRFHDGLPRSTAYVLVQFGSKGSYKLSAGGTIGFGKEVHPGKYIEK